MGTHIPRTGVIWTSSLRSWADWASGFLSSSSWSLKGTCSTSQDMGITVSPPWPILSLSVIMVKLVKQKRFIVLLCLIWEPYPKKSCPNTLDVRHDDNCDNIMRANLQRIFHRLSLSIWQDAESWLLNHKTVKSCRAILMQIDSLNSEHLRTHHGYQLMHPCLLINYTMWYTLNFGQKSTPHAHSIARVCSSWVNSISRASSVSFKDATKPTSSVRKTLDDPRKAHWATTIFNSKVQLTILNKRFDEVCMVKTRRNMKHHETSWNIMKPPTGNTCTSAKMWCCHFCVCHGVFSESPSTSRLQRGPTSEFYRCGPHLLGLFQRCHKPQPLCLHLGQPSVFGAGEQCMA